MRLILITALYLFPRVLLAQDCPPRQNVQETGPTTYQGQQGVVFTYNSVSGKQGDYWTYQKIVKNKGKEPLTVQWDEFYRRGVAAGTTALGPCLKDGNTPNKKATQIRYGFNVQLQGPNAVSFQPAMLAVMQRPVGDQPIPPYGFISTIKSLTLGRAEVVYDAQLENGEKAGVNLVFEATREGERIIYRIANRGQSVLLTLGAPRVVLWMAEKNTAAARLFSRLGFRPTMVEMTRELPEMHPRGSDG